MLFVPLQHADIQTDVALRHSGFGSLSGECEKEPTSKADGSIPAILLPLFVCIPKYRTRKNSITD